MAELPRTLRSLMRARRMVDDQSRRPNAGGPEYNDYLPWVLECLLDVRRTLHKETVSLRATNAAFQRWWTTIMTDPEFGALNDARNRELKDGRRWTTEVVLMPSTGGNFIQVSGVSIGTTDAKGRQEDYDVAYVGPPPAGATVTHVFKVKPWLDLPVGPVLDTLLEKLEKDIYPAALNFVEPMTRP